MNRPVGDRDGWQGGAVRPGRPRWADRLAATAAAAQWDEGLRVVPPEGGARASAVLVLLGSGVDSEPQPSATPAGIDDGADVGVVLLERASTMRRHAGQIAFPGGAVDPADSDPAATALREAREEVGLDAGSIDVLANLAPVHIPFSGYVVTPVLAYWREPHPIGVVDRREVAAVAVVPVAELAAARNRFTVRHRSGYAGTGFEVDGLFVWGFTAAVLDLVLRIAGWEKPWERARELPVPAAVGRP